MSGILILTSVNGYDYSFGERSIVCDGLKCLIRDKYVAGHDPNDTTGYTLFELDEKRKAGFEKALPLLRFISENTETTVPRSYSSDTKVVLVPESEGPKAFDPELSIDGYVKDAPYLNEDDILPLFSLFMPKELLPYGEEYLERRDPEQLVARITREMTEAQTTEDKIPLETVFFGSYPQDLVKDEELISELDAWYSVLFEKVHEDYFEGTGYSAADYNGYYMLYCDVGWKDDVTYRAVMIIDYRPITADGTVAGNAGSPQEANGFKKNKIYWFRYRPVEWIGFKTKNKYRLIAKKVLDAEPMCNTLPHQLTHVFDYSADSLFPRWFEIYASMEEQFNYEYRVSLDLAIPTAGDFKEFFPAKALRVPEPTDYALIKGYLRGETTRNAIMHVEEFVWTSTYIDTWSNRMAAVISDGTIVERETDNIGLITLTCGGVRPIMNLRGILPPAKNT